MASKEESVFLENINDNFLSCSVCSARYKNAKILPCVHTFCEQCLRKIVEKSGELTCPICRRSHELPAGGVAELSANVFVDQLVEEFNKQDEKKAALRKCEACQKGEIKERCVDCAANICSNCSQAHGFFPTTRSHRIFAIDEYQRAKFNNPASVRPPAYCSKHHDNQVKFYCDTCEVTICLECTAIDHPRPEHKFRYLDDAAVEYKQLLTKMTQELQIKENEAGESKAAVQQMTESVDSRFQEEIMKVKVHMEKTIEETTHKIRENGDSLLQQLKTEHEERKTNLQAQLKDLECTENDIAATRDYADKLMQYGNASQLMSAKKSMTSQIRELLKVTTKCEPVDDDYVEFQSTDNFCETKTLGTIKVTEEKRYELCGVSEYSRVDEQITLTLQVRPTGSRTGGTKVTRERITALMKTPDDNLNT
ncbi:E3 ubiquitin-protein ligase TRIM56-like [Ptychodera flava]|uniref:E3 ubiquitin-protein ligase TRIM56-like n=1 Tax=Ptychodera flava TaxID=63121 RepID=UPI00396A75C5